MFVSTLEVKRIPDIAHDGLVGRVRLIREYRFFETRERPDYKSELFKRLKGSPYLTISYNEKGDMTEQSYLHGPPKIVYNYDAEGNRTVNQWFDGRGTNSGRPEYPVPGRPYKEEYEYDAFGRRVEMLIKEVPYRWHAVYSYDGKGRLDEEHLYSLKGEGSLIRRILYTYYTNGTLKQEMWHGGSGLLEDELSYSDHEYDSRGNWIIRKEVRHQHYDKNMPAHQTYWAYREITYY